MFAVVLSHLLPDGGQSEWAADLTRRHVVPAATGETIDDD